MDDSTNRNEKLIRQGFILAYRKIRQNFLWEPGRPRTRLEAWLDVLMEAQHAYDPQPVLIKGSLFHCYRGQCLKSLETWAQRWAWSKTKTRRFLKTLENETMVVLKSEQKTTRLTVVNYDTYQISRNSDETAEKTQTGRQTIPEAIYRQRRVKEGGNNGERMKKVFSSDSVQYGLAQLLLNLIRARKSDFKEPNLQAWARQVDYMIRLDHRKPERIKAVIRWCQADGFWRSNILSTDNLRRHFDRLEILMEKGEGDGKSVQSRRDFSQQTSSIGTTIELD